LPGTKHKIVYLDKAVETIKGNILHFVSLAISHT
jgi:hypothetical protein